MNQTWKNIFSIFNKEIKENKAWQYNLWKEDFENILFYRTLRRMKENLIRSIMFIGNKAFSKKNVFARLIQEYDISNERDELYYVY